LHFVVEDQNKGSTSTSEDVGEGTLEEGLTTFILVDLSEAVKSTGVHDFCSLSTRLHHQSSSDSIKGIRHDTGERSDALGNNELEENGGILTSQDGSLSSIVTTEIASSVGNDTEDGDTESLVKTLNTIRSSDLVEAINKIDFKVLLQRAVGNLDLDKIPKDKINDIVYMAVHCAMNGPVGVNKPTSWPGNKDLDNCSIKSKVDCSNSQWKGFVGLVAGELSSKNPEELKGCYTVMKFGSLWPSCDAVFLAKVRK